MDKVLYFIKRLIPRKLFKLLQPVYHFLLSWLAAVMYGFPGNKLIVIGVTGTTGKTTSVYLIAKMLESAGIKTGFTSTAVFNDGEREWLNDKKMTMGGRFFTQKILRRMLSNNCLIAIIETTSEGIRQFRHRFINYDILVFTGLYEEHIESHGSFEKYKEAKGALFDHFRRCKTKYADDELKIKKSETGIKKIELNRIKKTIIGNGNDEHIDYFLNFGAERKIVYAVNGVFDLNGREIEVLDYSNITTSPRGASFKTLGSKINLNLLGEFSAVNAMNAVSVGIALGLEIKKIKHGLEKVKGIDGRMERIDEGQNFSVIIDYAYEPKALGKLYEILGNIPHNRIINVLGSAGGGRDIARRPKLGEIAGKKADIAIITNEDPYDDDPEIIIDQVAMGAENAGKKEGINLFKILDREKAIKKALKLAENNDIVVITGKGSEQAICTAHGKKIPWDDRVVAREILKGEKQ